LRIDLREDAPTVAEEVADWNFDCRFLCAIPIGTQ
jgi:hypothetical protein